jgi:hypothetical protein
VANRHKLGIRLWIMWRDEMIITGSVVADRCVRGVGEACAEKPERVMAQNSRRLIDYATRLPKREFAGLS